MIKIEKKSGRLESLPLSKGAYSDTANGARMRKMHLEGVKRTG